MFIFIFSKFQPIVFLCEYYIIRKFSKIVLLKYESGIFMSLYFLYSFYYVCEFYNNCFVYDLFHFHYKFTTLAHYKRHSIEKLMLLLFFFKFNQSHFYLVLKFSKTLRYIFESLFESFVNINKLFSFLIRKYLELPKKTQCL